MNNIFLINYSRHKVPLEIYKQFQLVIDEAGAYDYVSIYKYDNLNITSAYSEMSSDFSLDLYLNIKNQLEKLSGNPTCFCVESDVLYPEEHFLNGEKSVQNEPSFIHCNQNFLQKNTEHDFRKYPGNVHIFSSLCATKDTLLKHINDKISEHKTHGKVEWLEPGYHKNGQTFFITFKSEYPCVELRHEWSSTALGKNRSFFSKNNDINDALLPDSIAVMCPLTQFTSTYSVAKCVYDQLDLLSRKYKQVTFITVDKFENNIALPENIVIQTFPIFTGEMTAENCSLYTQNNYEQLCEVLSEFKYLITHDVIFIDGFKAYNSLLRRSVENNDNLKMIHYIHSAPSIIDRSNCNYPEILNRIPLKKSKYICLNEHNIDLLSQMYMIDKSDIIFAPNSIDMSINYDFHSISKEIIYENKLYDYDIVCVYPARVCNGKQQAKLTRLLAEVNNIGLKVCIVFLASYMNSKESESYVDIIKAIAKKFNFENNIFFSHEHLSRWCDANDQDITNGVPHKVSSDLMQFADLFILPSVSEGCSLVMLEAAIAKNCIILNDDLSTLKDFGGKKDATIKKSHYVPFGSIENPRPVGFSDDEYSEMAQELIRHIQSNSSLNFYRYVRKYHFPDYIFDNVLKPHLS